MCIDALEFEECDKLSMGLNSYFYGVIASKYFSRPIDYLTLWPPTFAVPTFHLQNSILLFRYN